MKPVIGRGLRTIAAGLDHPEGVCWSPDEEAVYAGGEAGQLYRFGLDGGVDTVATVPGGFLLGMALDAHRNVYACDPNSGYVMRISPDGDLQRHGERVGYPNYPVFDRDGNLWVTDSGAWDEVTGGLVRIAPDGATERVDVPALRFANGCAISDDHLYLVESQMPGVVRMPLSGGELEPVVELPRTVPDGLAVDAEGGIWIGCYQPNRIYRLDAGGALDMVVDDWTGEYVMSPTNLAFAGDQLDVLVLASLCGWAVKAIDPGVAGAPLVRPTVVAGV